MTCWTLVLLGDWLIDNARSSHAIVGIGVVGSRNVRGTHRTTTDMR
jgi:hypothetical protein